MLWFLPTCIANLCDFFPKIWKYFEFWGIWGNILRNIVFFLSKYRTYVFFSNMYGIGLSIVLCFYRNIFNLSTLQIGCLQRRSLLCAKCGHTGPMKSWFRLVQPRHHQGTMGRNVASVNTYIKENECLAIRGQIWLRSATNA